MKTFHDVMNEPVSFTFVETSPAIKTGFCKSGQAIQPPEPATFVVETIEFLGIEITNDNLNEHPSFGRVWEEVEQHISRNYHTLTKEY